MVSPGDAEPASKALRRLAIIVPAFNEADSIAAVIADAAALEIDAHKEIVVVNDGSRDATSAVAHATGRATVIDLRVNLGIGGAVQTGFKYALRRGCDLAVQLDGDGQHIAAEIPKLLDPLLRGDADMVIGSRFCGDAAPATEDATAAEFRSTRARRAGIKVFELINRLLLRQRISDSTSGFRGYNRGALAFLAQHYPADYPEPEAVIMLGRHGFRVQEVRTHMRARQAGRSSIAGLRSLFYMAKVILAMVMTRLRPLRRGGPRGEPA